MKPILFNTEMVRAILEGRKTVTRRIMPDDIADKLVFDDAGLVLGVYSPGRGFEELDPLEDHSPYKTGDVLYVRETWSKDTTRYMYKADYLESEKFYMDGKEIQIKWRPSIHMPKEAARLFLRVVDVWAELLQDITTADVKAEGAVEKFGATQGSFVRLWNSTIKPENRERYGWGSNPWVWVIEFERISKEEATKNGF